DYYCLLSMDGGTSILF
nr:immunoglobulin light chain junction region [Macaca mulatta]MOX80834.1 immunoglobulin light chain junction region [Macaca mulatta]MOX81393.1 immunoglobulin light chain junction region [Macaca mulatta]MOX83806.1 immunoglobulin light chain junction region [Macaca mulatta]